MLIKKSGGLKRKTKGELDKSKTSKVVAYDIGKKAVELGKGS